MNIFAKIYLNQNFSFSYFLRVKYLFEKYIAIRLGSENQTTLGELLGVFFLICEINHNLTFIFSIRIIPL